MNNNIYLETGELMEMRRLMEDADVPEDAIRDTLIANADEFEDKGIALYQATDEIDYQVEMLDKAIKDLQGRKKMLQGRKESMRNALLQAMIDTGISKIGCPFFTISTKKGIKPLVIDDEKAIPDDYVEVEVVNKVDKNALRRALNDGEVEGAHLGDAPTLLQVRKS